MLSLVSERRTLDFRLDGSVVSLPVELDLDELRAMNDVYAKTPGLTVGDDGDVSTDGMTPADAMYTSQAMLEWFCSFACRHVPALEGLSADAMSEIKGAWDEERKASGAPTEGER